MGIFKLILEELFEKYNNPQVVVVNTASEVLLDFLVTQLKKKYDCTKEAVIKLEKQTDIAEIKTLYGLLPPTADRWFVQADLDKLYCKELVEAVKKSNTCIFFLTSKKYATSKSFMSAIDKFVENKVYFYLNRLRKKDFNFLYEMYVQGNNRLIYSLYNYVYQAYNADVDAVMKLFIELNKGEEFKSRKAIAELCGIGSNTTQSFALSLLKPISGKEKGLRRMIRDRVKAGIDLVDTYTARTLYNYVCSNIRIFTEMKGLLIAGIVYDKIPNDLPESYDLQGLQRNQKYLDKVKEIPLSRLLLLYNCLMERYWKNSEDMLNFLYNYYAVYYKVKAVD